MFRFEQLEVWRLAVDYGKACYKIAREFPKYEMFGLGDQLRRASVSISNNIAEGSIGSSALNFRKYINVAIGSVSETVNILNFAYELQYIPFVIKGEMYEEAEKLIRKLIKFAGSLH